MLFPLTITYLNSASVLGYMLKHIGLVSNCITTNFDVVCVLSYSDPYCKVTVTSNNKKTSKQTKMFKKVLNSCIHVWMLRYFLPIITDVVSRMAGSVTV